MRLDRLATIVLVLLGLSGCDGGEVRTDRATEFRTGINRRIERLPAEGKRNLAPIAVEIEAGIDAWTDQARVYGIMIADDPMIPPGYQKLVFCYVCGPGFQLTHVELRSVAGDSTRIGRPNGACTEVGAGFKDCSGLFLISRREGITTPTRDDSVAGYPAVILPAGREFILGLIGEGEKRALGVPVPRDPADQNRIRLAPEAKE